MGDYHVIGGNKISGETRISGGKNAILPILASVVLNNGISIIHNCPIISDTFTSIEILEALGCKTKLEGSTLIVDSSTANNTVVPEHLASEMRSSIIFLGGILGRFNKVLISRPGGCELGLRPIDLHKKSLKEMNVTINETHGFLECSSKKIKGAKINLDFPSVGATENIMLSAVLAEGETYISNAAKEPEIMDLQLFLNGMGAKVRGAGTDTIVIEGVKKLHDVTHTVMPDRIVAGTMLVAAAITRGSITLTNINPEHIYPITSKLLETGCIVQEEKTKIHLHAPNRLYSVDQLRTYPHPGFPTDMQPQFMALLCTTKGRSMIYETIFESRNKHISELMKMGADIQHSPDGITTMIHGVSQLKGAVVSSKDLRGGAALILAGLAAEGETFVVNSKHVKRGYEHFEKTLSEVGANVTFVE